MLHLVGNRKSTGSHTEGILNKGDLKAGGSHSDRLPATRRAAPPKSAAPFGAICFFFSQTTPLGLGTETV